MPYAKRTITVPDSVWMGSVSRTHSGTRFRVLAATASDSSGVARIELIGPDPETAREKMREYDAVTDLTVFEADPSQYEIQVETTMPLLLTPIQASGVPIGDAVRDQWRRDGSGNDDPTAPIIQTR